MIVIVNYGRGNLFSIEQALVHLGAECKISNDHNEILKADHLILPGVGAFGDAMRTLRSLKLDGPIRQRIEEGTPLLGICLGMQMLFDGSEEFGKYEGLGFLRGVVRRLPEGTMRIPNVGWRLLYPNAANHFLADIDQDTMVYFVHSYAVQPKEDAAVAATISFNGQETVIAVQHENIMGFQFHPEKSGPKGLMLLERFLTASARI